MKSDKWTVPRIEDALRTLRPASTHEEFVLAGLKRWSVAQLRKTLSDALKEGQWEMAHTAQNALWNHALQAKLANRRDIPLQRRIGMCRNSMPARSYLFVSGVARSGTIALGRLLGFHAKIAMFIELYSPIYGYVPEMFCAATIRDYASSGLLKLTEINERALAKFLHAEVVGDKRPGFISSAGLTFRNFDSDRLTVVHLVRDIVEVALSFEMRRSKGTGQKDYKQAVLEANASNRTTLRLWHGGYSDKIIILNYSDFWSDEMHFYALLSYFGLDYGGIATSHVRHFFAGAKLVREKPRIMTAEQSDFIKEHYDFATAKELSGISEQFRSRN